MRRAAVRNFILDWLINVSMICLYDQRAWDDCDDERWLIDESDDTKCVALLTTNIADVWWNNVSTWVISLPLTRLMKRFSYVINSYIAINSPLSESWKICDVLLSRPFIFVCFGFFPKIQRRKKSLQSQNLVICKLPVLIIWNCIPSYLPFIFISFRATNLASWALPHLHSWSPTNYKILWY